ncbi:hypothetical protein PR003_g12102 [Phytophthora rubi]|uniref:Uncharacterized protein n=1 Tax=Phytophthora rubi TaxID=129364 RepID=A0A6A3I9I1_9STRA|nr:hypothetical protein PR001_g24928 [Phytophthora rubi]KAE9026006.1 hypothetical protein PR002_g11031 [Phytophthora rubi]KAE9337259.1 hypothetical protein PR003_g12102 [Phytophthora rubi]
MGTLTAEHSDGGSPLAKKLPSAAKAAPAAEGGPTVLYNYRRKGSVQLPPQAA